MKNYVSPELLICAFDRAVLTYDILSASNESTHEKTDNFDEGWFD